MPKNKQGGKGKKAEQKQQEVVKPADTESIVSEETESSAPNVRTSLPEDPYVKAFAGKSLAMGAKESTEAAPEGNVQTSTSGTAFADEQKGGTGAKLDTDEDVTADAIFQDIETPDEKSASLQAKTESSQVVGEFEPSEEEATEKLVSHSPLDVDTVAADMGIGYEEMASAPRQAHPPLTPLVRHEDTYPSIAEEEENIDYYIPEKENHPFASPSQLNDDAGFDTIFKDIHSPVPYTQPKHVENHQARAGTPKAYLSPDEPQAVVKGLQVLEEEDKTHSYTAIAEDIIGSVQSRASQFLSGAPEVFDLSKSAAKIDSFLAQMPWPLRMLIPSIVLMTVKYTLLWYLCLGRFAYNAFCATIKLYLFLALLPLRCLEKGLEWSFQLSVYITVWFLNRVPGGHKIPTALNGHVEK